MTLQNSDPSLCMHVFIWPLILRKASYLGRCRPSNNRRKRRIHKFPQYKFHSKHQEYKAFAVFRPRPNKKVILLLFPGHFLSRKKSWKAKKAVVESRSSLLTAAFCSGSSLSGNVEGRRSKHSAIWRVFLSYFQNFRCASFKFILVAIPAKHWSLSCLFAELFGLFFPPCLTTLCDLTSFL